MANVEDRLSRLRLKNVRCFEEVEIPLDSHMTILIGENGAGKTTVAEAMASLSYGNEEGLRQFPLRWERDSGEIALYEANAEEPAAVWRHGSAQPIHQRLAEDRYLFAYGRYRRISDPAIWEGDAAESYMSPAILLDELARSVSQRRTSTLSKPDGRLLLDLNRYLAAIHEGMSFDPNMRVIWERLEKSLAALRQGLQGIEMERGEYGYTPKIIRRGVRHGLHELSDGYQAVLVMIFDLILRYAYLFNTLDDPLMGTAMVIIDEVDLHLHVRWQRTVLQQLTALFPATQFVITTHSPAVVQAAIDEGHSVVLLRESRGMVKASALSTRARSRLEHASIGSVFVEKMLFGAASRYSSQVQAEEDEVSRLRRKVEAGRATETDQEHLFELLNHLEEVTAADEERHEDGRFMSEMGKLRLAFLRDLAEELDEEGEA